MATVDRRSRWLVLFETLLPRPETPPMSSGHAVGAVRLHNNSESRTEPAFLRSVVLAEHPCIVRRSFETLDEIERFETVGAEERLRGHHLQAGPHHIPCDPHHGRIHLFVELGLA